MDSFARQIADMAVEALYAELDTTPKPGLIDKNNSGAHQDMDYNTMAKSITALTPYFGKFVQVAQNSNGLEQLATSLKLVGINAERAMYRATNGVNTHKGAIFLFGLFIGALCYKYDSEITLGQVSFRMGKIAEVLSRMHTPERTHGNLASQEYNIPTALEQAKSGFFPVLLESVYILLMCDDVDMSDNEARVRALLNIMSCIEDTTVYYRGGKAGADMVKREVRQLIRDFSINGVERLDKKLIDSNISCGGSADLLALSILVYNLYKQGLIDIGQEN
ncbi:MAG: triphosphoribosyl-dephospho-CoA synthase [Clostridia bacterium]|nr:triphosphoribosyl-dephospho-CoA synthase [Clostridia bacterium]